MKKQNETLNFILGLTIALTIMVSVLSVCSCQLTPEETVTVKEVADTVYDISPIPAVIKEAARPLWEYIVGSILASIPVIYGGKKVHGKLKNSDKGKLLG